MTGTEENPAGCLFAVLGLAVIIGAICLFCKSSNNSSKTYANEQEEIYEKKVYSGTYSATVTGTHEYRKDINGDVHVRNDTTTVIE